MFNSRIISGILRSKYSVRLFRLDGADSLSLDKRADKDTAASVKLVGLAERVGFLRLVFWLRETVEESVVFGIRGY